MGTLSRIEQLLFLCIYGCFIVLGCQFLHAQLPKDQPKPITIQPAEKVEDGPRMFKFEPDFMEKSEAKKAKIELARKILDTMPIPERRKRKLLKDLYKNGVSNRLSKSVLVDVKFEDIDK